MSLIEIKIMNKKIILIDQIIKIKKNTKMIIKKIDIKIIIKKIIDILSNIFL